VGELYFTVLASILNIALPYAVTRRDRRTLSAEQLARAWNGPSWACALFFFGPLCLPAHFWVTRRTALGLLQGAGWATAVMAAEYLLAFGVEKLAP
jgi:hypothetical protein